MKIIFLLWLIFNLNSCGFKGPPSPIFPTSSTQIDEEIKLRNKHQEQEKKLKTDEESSVKQSFEKQNGDFKGMTDGAE